MNQLTTFIEKYVQLSEEERNVLSENSKYAILDKNEISLLQGEKSHKLVFLYEGAVRYFYTTEDGEEINTEFIVNQGFVIDFISYTRKLHSQFSIQALEKSEVIIIDFRHFKIETALIEKLQKLSSLYVNDVCLPSLYHYQLILSEKPAVRYEVFAKKYPVLIQKIPQKHIASYLRLRPETISRIRRRFLDLNQLTSQNL